MKEYIKSQIKNLPFIVIVFVLLYGTITLADSYLFDSSRVKFDTTGTDIQAGDVQGAIGELYTCASNYSVYNSRLETIEGLVTNNAGINNSIFRGKNLGTSVTTDQWTAISNGTFEDLYVGDYWVINSVTWRIAGFDIYYGKGDTAFNTHHAVIVPDTNLKSSQMNSSNVTTGGYVGSAMYTSVLGTSSNKTGTVLETIENAFGSSHVLTYRNQLTTSISGDKANNWGWQDRKLDLMNENQVYGSIVWSSSGYETGSDNVQFPLFRLRPEFINKARSWYWLRSVASSSDFAGVLSYGGSNHYAASMPAGVRPYFYIG